MTEFEWPLVRELFEACLDLEPMAREAVMANADPAVRAEVAELLAVADRETEDRSRYQPIGVGDVGGRGLVLRATDRDSGGVEVILKMFRVRAGQVETARQWLAAQVAASRDGGLSHVVRWTDAGLDTERVAWVVAEQVSGQALPEWLVVSKPARAVRRSVFCAIQLALNSARRFDLPALWPKPTQVLIDAEGQPRLTDVGVVATVAVDPSPEPSLPTASSGAMLECATLLFPEQAFPPDATAEQILETLRRT